MSLVENLQRKLEKNCIKSELDGEVVYLGKGSILSWLPLIGDWFKEWGQVYPPVNEDGKPLWGNIVFGGWRNFTKLLIIMGIMAMAFYGVYEMLSGMQSIINTTCVQNCINPISNYAPIN